MKKFLFAGLLFFASVSFAQITPEIYSWKQNLTGVTGYNGILADVQQVFYSANFSYVKCTGIPSYTIGPWAMNPNTPSNQNWVFKIARFPVPDPTPAAAGNGQIGVLTNGVVLFNSGDAMSYNNQNIWHRVAQYFEAVSFDTSGGHPAPGGVYHYHINMKKLYTPNASEHSPILGYMFDGYPLYGPYAYSNVNGTGGIRRMKSGFVKRNITTRTTLPNGTVLPPNQYGPPVSTQYPLGCFIEDYEVTISGTDLDLHNGRFSVTPEYPNGIYAYFLAVDSLGNPEFPYIIGSTYYGEVVAGNTPPGGHVTITEPVTQYIPATGIENTSEAVEYYLYQNYPNPFNPATQIKFETNKSGWTRLIVYDMSGKEVTTLLNEKLIPGSYAVTFNGNGLSSGIYYYTLFSGKTKQTKKMLLIK
ncbi:MAG: YHYH protein [Ignavibacteria bacterium]|nr:YHYH protein [Ignavibacteria bacterium]